MPVTATTDVPQLLTDAGPLVAGAVLLAATALVYLVTRQVVLRAIRAGVTRTRTTVDDLLVRRGVPHRLSLVPALLVVYLGIDALPSLSGGWVDLVQRVAISLVLVSVAMALGAALDAANDVYEQQPYAIQRPIKGYLQVVELLIYLFVAVIVVATLVNRSPVLILSGLGAATAVLLLVFRDTILSLVASVQLASNDMVRIGDWIEVPQYGADGAVIDMALHTVKVQNWDKTITTVPTYKLISESFRNWRGMTDAGGRCIKRAIHLDVGSVRFLEDRDLGRLRRFALLDDYLADRLAVVAPDGHHDPEAALTDGARRLTNLGTYRAYVAAYLHAHEDLHDDMTFLVRQLPPGPEGVAIEVYVFSRTTQWSGYEDLQADLFDHLLAVLPAFDLRVFQHPTGADVAAVSNGVTAR